MRSGIILRHPVRQPNFPLVRFDVALLTGFSVLALLVASAIFALASQLWAWEGLGLGVLGWWLVATIAASLWLPGASYAVLWPLLAILAGQAASFVQPCPNTIALVSAWLGVVPLLVLHVAFLRGVFNGLNLTVAAPLMVLVVLLGTALVPLASQVLTQTPTGNREWDIGDGAIRRSSQRLCLCQPPFQEAAEVFDLFHFFGVVKDRFGPPLEILDVRVAGIVERVVGFAQARLKAIVEVRAA